MPKMIDGRKYWSAEEAEFLSGPENLKTKEQNEEARDYYVAKDINYLLECILDDIDPITGRHISEEEQELIEKRRKRQEDGA